MIAEADVVTQVVVDFYKGMTIINLPTQLDLFPLEINLLVIGRNTPILLDVSLLS